MPCSLGTGDKSWAFTAARRLTASHYPAPRSQSIRQACRCFPPLRRWESPRVGRGQKSEEDSSNRLMHARLQERQPDERPDEDVHANRPNTNPVECIDEAERAGGPSEPRPHERLSEHEGNDQHRHEVVHDREREEQDLEPEWNALAEQGEESRNEGDVGRVDRAPSPAATARSGARPGTRRRGSRGRRVRPVRRRARRGRSSSPRRSQGGADGRSRA
jgi:hypothetical protein